MLFLVGHANGIILQWSLIFIFFSECGKGSFSATSVAPCSPCARDTYAPESGMLKCIKCPEGRTTVTTGSIEITDCRSKNNDL